MEIKSFVVTIAEFFMMECQETTIFDPNCKTYVIPKYQREYKWTEEKVLTLISDINNRDKFIGNLILNKVTNSYELVDGQQRITTLLLVLIALFNKHKLTAENERSEEQKDLLQYIFKGDSLTLENESIGKYIELHNNSIILSIKEDNDIYYQKDTFEKIYRIIKDTLEHIDDLMNFQKKLLDSQVLILVGDTRNRQNESIEEVFLDINFKSQLLDVADIFKGYCFKNYPTRYHDELKQQWTTVRKYTKEFEKIGYTDTKDTCEYLYHYLLSCPDTYDIPSNLSYRGKHYLEGKTHTETKKLLLDLGNYGENIIEFITNLSNDEYYFEDICSDANRYKTDTTNHQRMKKMLKSIILNKNVQYYKFPLFMFLHYLLKNDRLKSAFTYKSLKKFITNYYVYSLLFINETHNKNKKSIDHSIFDQIELFNNGTSAESVIQEITSATKELRKMYLDKYKQFEKFSTEKVFALYSLIDHYSLEDNYLKLLYSIPEYNIEHFIIHDNKKLDVTWNEDTNKFSFSLKELLGKPDGKTYIAQQYKHLTINYIILPYGLNESLRHDDIVQKIEQIKTYYQNQELELPKHISIFISHIENINEYKTLNDLKGQNKDSEEIKIAYMQFVKKYFSNESQNILLDKLECTFKNTFIAQV